MEKIKLTQFSRGSGCGCKIAPQVLEEILQDSKQTSVFKSLLVGNESADDAAVWKLNEEQSLICTADFFTPVVDDALTFGKIAAANAISDVYAMGGRPALALAILGFPVEKLPVEVAQEILRGAKVICAEAGIPLAGGHTIDSPEPLFGLTVNGFVRTENLRRNNTAREGDLLYLTKKTGTGILAAALKRNQIDEVQMKYAVESMCRLNSNGAQFGTMNEVHAMTDVTGFGLLGHLIEMCEGSGLSAEIYYDNILLFDGVKELAQKFVAPDNTFRNWKSFENKTSGVTGESLLVLCDPQTNGGLLIAVNEKNKNEIERFFCANELSEFTTPIGRMKKKGRNTCCGSLR